MVIAGELQVNVKPCIPRDVTDIGLLHTIRDPRAPPEIMHAPQTSSRAEPMAFRHTWDYHAPGLRYFSVCPKFTISPLLMGPPQLQDTCQLFECDVHTVDSDAASEWARLQDAALRRTAHSEQGRAEKLDLRA
ncbi:hypothetical protein NM688_g3886 [Phlebia brevispora]|uniref:Uncharacterized protein n=1 Tax=Phlebia brevispora TaxID=194682 RepID=A0ACC1T4B1_9APHY|nr:hypothetical protein NM688_g3886 [Phlebia brevispora]